MRPSVARILLAVVAVVAVIGVLAARGAEQDGSRVTTSAVGATDDPGGTPTPDRGSASNDDPAPLPVLAEAAPAVVADRWLNSPPLAAADLAGRVVLYEFWTFGCVNCRNVAPQIQAWHERYASEGLTVLTIHTPEFEYEADPGAVARHLRREGLTFPVALDPDRRTWRAFENHYWPAIYLHDRSGKRRLVHIGEGGYDETEDAIRTLLGVTPDAPRATPVTEDGR